MRYCLCDNRSNIRCDDTHCDLASLEGGPGNPNACRVCWIRLYGDPYSSPHASPQRTVMPTRTKVPKSCIHLGEVTQETVECPSCTGRVLIKLHECSIHTKCSPYKALPDIPHCPHCPDFCVTEETVET